MRVEMNTSNGNITAAFDKITYMAPNNEKTQQFGLPQYLSERASLPQTVEPRQIASPRRDFQSEPRARIMSELSEPGRRQTPQMEGRKLGVYGISLPVGEAMQKLREIRSRVFEMPSEVFDLSSLKTQSEVVKAAITSRHPAYSTEWATFLREYFEGRYNIIFPPDPPPMRATFTFLPALDPPNEVKRIAMLMKCNPVWTDWQEDRATYLVKASQDEFECSGVSISLIDSSNEILKAEIGYNRRMIKRTESISAHVLLTTEVLVVLDTEKDWRFSGNPLVVDKPKIRFYAGAPMLSPNGEAIGVFAIFGREPRDSFSVMQRRRLTDYSAICIEDLTSPLDKSLSDGSLQSHLYSEESHKSYYSGEAQPRTRNCFVHPETERRLTRSPSPEGSGNFDVDKLRELFSMSPEWDEMLHSAERHQISPSPEYTPHYPDLCEMSHSSERHQISPSSEYTPHYESDNGKDDRLLSSNMNPTRDEMSPSPEYTSHYPAHYESDNGKNNRLSPMTANPSILVRDEISTSPEYTPDYPDHCGSDNGKDDRLSSITVNPSTPTRTKYATAQGSLVMRQYSPRPFSCSDLTSVDENLHPNTPTEWDSHGLESSFRKVQDVVDHTASLDTFAFQIQTPETPTRKGIDVVPTVKVSQYVGKNDHGEGKYVEQYNLGDEQYVEQTGHGRNPYVAQNDHRGDFPEAQFSARRIFDSSFSQTLDTSEATNAGSSSINVMTSHTTSHTSHTSFYSQMSALEFANTDKRAEADAAATTVAEKIQFDRIYVAELIPRNDYLTTDGLVNGGTVVRILASHNCPPDIILDADVHMEVARSRIGAVKWQDEDALPGSSTKGIMIRLGSKGPYGVPRQFHTGGFVYGAFRLAPLCDGESVELTEGEQKVLLEAASEMKQILFKKEEKKESVCTACQKYSQRDSKPTPQPTNGPQDINRGQSSHLTNEDEVRNWGQGSHLTNQIQYARSWSQGSHPTNQMQYSENCGENSYRTNDARDVENSQHDVAYCLSDIDAAIKDVEEELARGWNMGTN